MRDFDREIDIEALVKAGLPRMEAERFTIRKASQVNDVLGDWEAFDVTFVEFDDGQWSWIIHFHHSQKGFGTFGGGPVLWGDQPEPNLTGKRIRLSEVIQ